MPGPHEHDRPRSDDSRPRACSVQVAAERLVSCPALCRPLRRAVGGSRGAPSWRLAVGGVFLAGCQPKEQIVYVSPPTPTAPPCPDPSADRAAGPSPAPGTNPAASTDPGVPIGAIQAQSQVIPPLPVRTRPYST